MLGCKQLSTPIELEIKYGIYEDSVPIEKGKY